MSEEENTPFYVGLCMAGAVSAGAYTAGVMDYLIEALEEWEKRKIEDPENTPSHQVIIPVLGGASAGGMTSIITSSAIQRKITPIRTIEDAPKAPKTNKLYDSWVNLTADDMFPELLDTNDLNKGKVKSLFNSDFISKIANKTLVPDENLPLVDRPYFTKNLKVFTTLTNLNGIPFHQRFNSEIENSSYHISKHSDFAAFELNTAQYNRKGWMPLNFENSEEREVAINAAMATGAFPIGLRARKLSRNAGYVNELAWHSDITKVEPIAGTKFDTLNIDGGTINNEPYEKVRDVLIECGAGNIDDKDYSKVKSTVLMIDPFPSEEPLKEEKEDDIFSILGSTLASMMNHLRFEPKNMESCNNPDDASKYLIAPLRYDENKKKIEGKKAIACGFLGGFGGFIHKDFRQHDYFLGRANCEQFLREHFTIPVESKNPIIEKGYRHIQNKNKHISSNNKFQIIPIFSEKASSPYLPKFESGTTWPSIHEKQIKRFKKPMRKRFGKIIMKLVGLKGISRAFLWIGNKVILKKIATNKFYGAIKSDMNKWGLLR